MSDWSLTSLSEEPHCCSWFGKLPSEGDFLHRRMSAERIRFWDDYLSQSMVAVLQEKTAPKLMSYLNSNVWMFCMSSPNLYVGDAKTWGVVVPSMDKVGRYFPLVCERAQIEGACLTQHLKWLHVVAGFMCEAIDVEWSLDVFDLRLSAACRLDSVEEENALECILPPGGSRWWKTKSTDFFKSYSDATDYLERGPLPHVIWAGDTYR